jgi:hypothetical protein
MTEEIKELFEQCKEKFPSFKEAELLFLVSSGEPGDIKEIHTQCSNLVEKGKVYKVDKREIFTLELFKPKKQLNPEQTELEQIKPQKTESNHKKKKQPKQLYCRTVTTVKVPRFISSLDNKKHFTDYPGELSPYSKYTNTTKLLLIKFALENNITSPTLLGKIFGIPKSTVFDILNNFFLRYEKMLLFLQLNGPSKQEDVLEAILDYRDSNPEKCIFYEYFVFSNHYFLSNRTVP